MPALSPGTAEADLFRHLRLALEAQAEAGSPRVVVAGITHGDVNVWIGANVALALAGTGRRVLLVDGRMGERFGTPVEDGAGHAGSLRRAARRRPRDGDEPGPGRPARGAPCRDVRRRDGPRADRAAVRDRDGLRRDRVRPRRGDRAAAGGLRRLAGDGGRQLDRARRGRGLGLGERAARARRPGPGRGGQAARRRPGRPGSPSGRPDVAAQGAADPDQPAAARAARVRPDVGRGRDGGHELRA